jgi:DNA-binding IclR family transcriptional regulator
MTSKAQAPAWDFEDVVELVKAEYREMPGLNLTFDQAKRLWGLEQQLCHRVLDSLIAQGFLTQTPRGGYARVA